MDKAQLEKYSAKLNEEIMKAFQTGFARCEDKEKWIMECQSVMRDFVLNRVGWKQSMQSDDTFIFNNYCHNRRNKLMNNEHARDQYHVGF